MSDEEDDAEPAVALGDGPAVEGAPLARVTSRLTWPKEASEIDRLEGESVVRTPEGPRELSAIVAEIDQTYFERRQEFEGYVREQIGTGPVRAADD